MASLRVSLPQGKRSEAIREAYLNMKHIATLHKAHRNDNR